MEFKKKEPVVQAIQYHGSTNFAEVQAFVGDIYLDNLGEVTTPGFDVLGKWLDPEQFIGEPTACAVFDPDEKRWLPVFPGFWIVKSDGAVTTYNNGDFETKFNVSP